MIVAIVNEDIVIGRGSGIIGPEIPPDLIDLSDARLRFVGEEIVDVGPAVRTFYIDEIGLKHIIDAPGRQALHCTADDVLKGAAGTWAVKVPSDDLRAIAADLRWQSERAGTVWHGWPIHTDAGSQGKYLSELQAISLGARTDGDPWKFGDGQFRPVANADFPALAIAAREHVRAVFGIEGMVLAAIEDGTITTEAEVRAAFGL